MNEWIMLGYFLVAFCGLRFLDAQEWGNINCSYAPAMVIAFGDVVIFSLFVVAEVPFLAAIPIASLITMSLIKLTSSQAIESIWLSSIYLTGWMYVIVVFFYLIGLFSVLIAGLGGLSESDRYYY